MAVLIALMALLFGAVGPAQGATTNVLYNPVVRDLADPSVLFHNGYYYFTYSDLSNDIYVVKSKHLSRVGDGVVKKVWSNPSSGAYCCEVWAPELQLINGKFYVYFAADDGNNANHRMYALEANSGDPQGSYTFRGKVAAPTDRWAIDGVVVQQGSSLYFVWSGWEGYENVQQSIYIAPMSNPYTISGERAVISSPDQPWEQINAGALRINEAPQPLYRNGKIFLTYSANGSTTDDYLLGMLTASDTANLMDKRSWTKSGGPVFSKVDTAYGPGSNAFTTSPDGREDWIVYHANVSSGGSWENRSVRAQKFGWDSNGNPAFGKPASITTALELPSGERRSHVRYEAELAKVNRANVITRTGEHTTQKAASHDQIVGQIDYPDSYVEFTVDVPKAGTYALTEVYSNAFNETATHNVSVNGGASTAISLPSTGAWDRYAPATAQVNLRAGINTVRFSKGNHYAELDYVELPIYEAEYGVITHANIVTSGAASNGRRVGQIDYSDSSVLFDVYAPTAGTYTLRVAYSNAFSGTATHNVSVNGGTSTAINYGSTGSWDTTATATLPVNLNAGGNTIRLSKGSNWAELDYVEVYR